MTREVDRFPTAAPDCDAVALPGFVTGGRGR